MMISEKIYKVLKKRISEGVYAPGARFPSEDTLLEEFKVSKVTINKIVSALAAEELLVRGVRGAGTRVAKQIFRPRGSIAFIGKLNAYTAEILRGVQKESLHQNIFPVVFSPEAEELPFCLSMMNRRNVMGIVTVGYGILQSAEELPVVCLDYDLPHRISSRQTSFISSDNFTGGRNMVCEILRRGHRGIAIFSSERFVTGPEAPVSPRVNGFHQALREAGYADFAERTFYGMPDSLPDAKACLSAILKRYPDTTMICADSDHSAELLHQAAKSMNVSCPGNIGLTGFGNVTHLEIASVNQHPERQGQLAVRRVIAQRLDAVAAGGELVETELVRVESIPIRIR